jgi:hypothetical protein
MCSRVVEQLQVFFSSSTVVGTRVLQRGAIVHTFEAQLLFLFLFNQSISSFSFSGSVCQFVQGI